MICHNYIVCDKILFSNCYIRIFPAFGADSNLPIYVDTLAEIGVKLWVCVGAGLGTCLQNYWSVSDQSLIKANNRITINIYKIP